MGVLTLTTDWGLRDHYIASFKASLLAGIPGLPMIDISHEVEPFNTIQAAYIIKNSFRRFPVGSIHFLGVSGNENCTNEKPYVVIKSDGHFLLGEDNGIFSLILGNAEMEIIRLPVPANTEWSELTRVFTEAIGSLHRGKFAELGVKNTSLEESYFAYPTIDDLAIRGTIIYIDSYGNVVMNITRELFEQARKKRTFTILLRRAEYQVERISSSYEDVEVGEVLGLFNQDGYLEIAINKGSAEKLLGLKIMDSIRIEFDDNTTR